MWQIEKEQDGRHKPNHIKIICKLIKYFNEKAAVVIMNRKVRVNYMLFKRDTFKYKDTDKLMEKDILHVTGKVKVPMARILT